MSNRLLSASWNVVGLSCPEKCVLVNLADRADVTGSCFPRQELIASDCGLSERSVRTIIQSLKSKRLITIKRQAQRSYRGASLFTYKVHPTPESVSGVTPEAGASDTGKGRLPHRKMTGATPETGAVPIITSTNLINPQGNRPPENVSTAGRISMEKEMERIEARLKEIKDGCSHDAWGPMYSKDEKSKIKALKQRRAEILDRLGAKA